MIRIVINNEKVIYITDPGLEAFELGRSRLGLATLGFSSGDAVAINPSLTEHLNGADRLEYAIPYDDGYYDKYVKLNTHYELFDNDTLISSGRLIDDSVDLYGTKTLTFESALAYTNDVQYPPYEFDGTIAQFFTSVLTYYNSKCSERHKINIGQITVVDSNNHIVISNSNYSTAWECLNKLVNLYGGYLVMRYLNNTLTLDFLENPGTQNTQEIRFAENIINILRESVSDEFADVLIPLGAEDEDGNRLTIESVNEGKNYLENAQNVAVFGRIEAVKIWDDVTIAENLKSKAQDYLNALALKETITVNAVDLHNMDTDIQRLNLGDTIHVLSQPHNVDALMLLVERVRNLADVSKDTITLGSEQDTYTYRTMLENDRLADLIENFDINNLDSIIERQTEYLLSGKGGYYKTIFNDQGQPSGFYIMDSPLDSEAQNVILVNNYGIGFSHNGINGPFFNAWTIDGSLNASFIYTGILQDKTGNFMLNLDTGELTAEHFEIRTNVFRFGSDTQYIEMKNLEEAGVATGVILNGTGNIYMRPEGKLDFSNYKNGTLYNRFTMEQSSTQNDIYLGNRDASGVIANSLELVGVTNANTTYLTNYKTTADEYANSITMNCISTGNNFQLYNYNRDNTYIANSIYMNAASYSNQLRIKNRSPFSNNDQNEISLTAGVSANKNVIQLNNNAYGNAQNIGNRITINSEELAANKERSITLDNYNNANTTISNQLILYKKDTLNYVVMRCISNSIQMGTVEVSASNTGGGVLLQSRDRGTDSYVAAISLNSYDSNGSVKDGVYINGHQLYFSGGYVRYR